MKLGIVIYYECNRDYIARNLCENRTHPERKCCGKCYLRKQLNKAENHAPQGSKVPDKWNLGEVAVYVAPVIVQIPFVATERVKSIPLTNQRYLTHNPLNDVFHPPLSLA